MDDSIPDEIVPLPRLYERDIDVILREEILFSDDVRELFVSAVGLSGTHVAGWCRLSVDHATGETDILAQIVVADEIVQLLIEDKIDAVFQPNQPARYRARGDQLSEIDGYRSFAILVAPASYAATSEELASFHASVSYEDVIAAIRREGTPRALDRAGLMQLAIDKARRSYIMVPDDHATGFYSRLHGIASTEFPSLAMRTPGAKSGRSDWHIFKGHLPPNIVVDWKIRRGTMGLSFWRNASLRPARSLDLSPLGALALRREEGDTIIIETPTVTADGDWANMSDDMIRRALRDAIMLVAFYDTISASTD